MSLRDTGPWNRPFDRQQSDWFYDNSPESSRSTAYSTDVARMLDVLVFHVNGEDPEAVSQVIRFAMEFRDEFRRDVIIDMYCFRKYGHNEGDGA